METSIKEPLTDPPAISQRVEELFGNQRDKIYRRTDRMFARLMIFQWLAGIAAAIWLSPRTWIGTQSSVHLHVWAAILIGGVITSFPVYLVWKKPGEALTRHVVAVGQMLTSGLLIHLSGGRIETHFHIFGSLAFLAFYRDWRVLISATVVVAVDHLLRGLFWPQSVFGVLAASPWRWAEHAGWVVFEDFFLFLSIRQGLEEMRQVAERQASLESLNQGVENVVHQRTRELQLEVQQRTEAEAELSRERDLLETLLNNSRDYIYFKDRESRLTRCSKSLAERFPEDIIGKSDFELYADEHAKPAFDDEQQIMRTGQPLVGKVEKEVSKDGRTFWVLTSKMPLRDKAGEIAGTFGISKDITAIKQAEAELERTHQELLGASRMAGMAEVATSVLHNVGNTLNGVNVSVSVIGEKIKKSKSDNVAKVAALLRENSADLATFITQDAKGRQLPGFLSQLGEQLALEKSALFAETESLAKKVDHIKDIVAMQQGYSKVSGVTETVKVTDLVEDAVNMNASALARHDVQFNRDYAEPLPQITVEKHKVVQILVNLIRNAKQACDASGVDDKQMTLRVRNGGNSVRITLMDNGIGIAPENLTRIFNFGFTTKKEGHGYGLHSSALAAQEMGGSLSAQSEGVGKGAAFILELPCHAKGTIS